MVNPLEVSMDAKSLLNKVISDIENDMESGIFSLQSIFNNNVESLNKLKSMGVSYLTIYRNGNFPISQKHYQNLINRANKSSNSSSKNESVGTLVTKEKEVQTSNQDSVVGCFSDSDWKAIGIHNEYLISLLQETDLTPEEVKAWNCPNEIQLSTRVNEYRMRKMKKKKYSVTTEEPQIDLVEWKMIMPDISERLVRDIINKGYSKHDVEAWIREHKIPNSGSLRRYFNAKK